ncbi:hypothetical protein [Hyperthermus butylicus]|uniref:Conserved archaeal protein n=1 Tax=Hyperthermus butylicus (strain DSM 5456 / JCM 9403 / PLM1-5) TaxID=415426 RepID=A2BL03_HYPBU|nr:hypothetical protein [Hyperthermus butylicus]ABM80664.1 conserved archaeal protein [Hyperthermus butylicus DSM 5456]
MSSILMLYIIAIAAAVSVVWFFHIRRVMLMRMRGLVSLLERSFRPRDTQYMLLGYLVGFRAEYLLGDGPASRAWILYTTPPYHVFFYLPVISLGKRREKLEITLRLRSPLPGEAHIYDPGDRGVVRAVVADTAGAGRRLYRGTVSIAGRELEALYSGDIALAKAKSLFEELVAAGVDVRRVSIVDRLHALHVSVVPQLDTVEELVKRVMGFAGELQSSR